MCKPVSFVRPSSANLSLWDVVCRLDTNQQHVKCFRKTLKKMCIPIFPIEKEQHFLTWIPGNVMELIVVNLKKDFSCIRESIGNGLARLSFRFHIQLLTKAGAF